MDLKKFYVSFANNVGDKKGKNMENVCRFCLIKDENNQSIFSIKKSEDTVDENSWGYKKIFEYYSGLQVKKDDGLPNGVCENCLFKFESAHKLRKQCQETNKKMRIFIQQEKSTKQKKPRRQLLKSPRIDLTRDQHPEIKNKKLVNRQISNKRFRNFDVVIDPGTNCKKIIYYKVPKGLKEVSVKEIMAKKSRQFDDPKNELDQQEDGIEMFDPLDIEQQTELNLGFQDDPEDEEEENGPSVEENISKKVENEEENAPNEEENNPNAEAEKTTPTKSNETIQVEPGKKIKRYFCQYCSRGFMVKSKCTIHERVHTGDRPFVCEICGLTFARPYTLHEHLKNHKDEANYQCSKCTKTFKRLKYLKEHEFIHSGEKPYACKICGAAYRHSGTLYAHMKRCKTKPESSNEPIVEEFFDIPVDETFLEVFTS